MKHNCPDCGAKIGDLHDANCDIERCPFCGDQLLGHLLVNEKNELIADCNHKRMFDNSRIPWSGEWPGVQECREYDFWSKWVDGRGWVRCDKSDPDARESLNRLDEDCKWSATKKRWVLK